MTKLRFRAKSNTTYVSQSVKALLEREDDQIAPEAAAHSIDALQTWALHTANISQGSYKPNEAQTVERIHDRYVNEVFSMGSHEDIDQRTTSAHSARMLQDTAEKKMKGKKHTISPAGSLQLNTLYSKDTSDTGVRGKASQVETTEGPQPKRRRRRSSREGSFPGEGKDVISKAVAKEVEDKRTYV